MIGCSHGSTDPWGCSVCPPRRRVPGQSTHQRCPQPLTVHVQSTDTSGHVVVRTYRACVHIVQGIEMSATPAGELLMTPEAHDALTAGLQATPGITTLPAPGQDTR